ncbi:MAG: ParA family protein [Chloroflexaceae bacterium]|nr:ParA family protein [Chloroflexaceae bacterium]
MTIPVFTFFNNKGGVGKTSLVYHLAWMYVDRGLRVLAVDLDPQANATAAFLHEEYLESIFMEKQGVQTIFDGINFLRRGIGDVAVPKLIDMEMVTEIGDRLALIVGDLELSSFEDQLSDAWPRCLDRDERAFRVISAFWRIMQQAATQHRADIILVDLGPNLGAINRATLIATDYVVVPLAPDLFSLKGLRNLGPTLRSWRREWQERLERNPAKDLPLPRGAMKPIGYVVLQHSVRLDRPVKAYDRWIARIPEIYRSDVLEETSDEDIQITNDPYALALLKNYGALMPMAQEVHKPIFYLKSADGAIGSQMKAVGQVYHDFKALALRIAETTGISLPSYET